MEKSEIGTIGWATDDNATPQQNRTKTTIAISIPKPGIDALQHVGNVERWRGNAGWRTANQHDIAFAQRRGLIALGRGHVFVGGKEGLAVGQVSVRTSAGL